MDEYNPGLAPGARRGEWMFAFALVSAVVGLSLGNVKFYPFAPPNFFLARAHHYCRYSIVDPAGASLPLHEFGLGDFYTGQAGSFNHMPWQEHGAVKLPATGNIYGVVLTPAEVAALVQQGLRTRSDLPYVVVSQRIFGPIDEQGVGVIGDHQWRISGSSP